MKFTALTALLLCLTSSQAVSRKAKKSDSSSSSNSSDERDCSDMKVHDFNWRGQFAGFIVNGRFAYDAVPSGGIVREDDLIFLDVSFYDPQGHHLRTYADNHKSPTDDDGHPYLNFAFDTLSQEILHDGTWNVDDDDNRYRNGFTMGEGYPDLRTQNGVQSGLAFWSRPGDDKPPHLHVDDWNDSDGNGEFGFPIGYSSHEDASFMYRTTARQIAGGKVGKAYFDADDDDNVSVNKLASDIEAFGSGVRVSKSTATRADERRCYND